MAKAKYEDYYKYSCGIIRYIAEWEEENGTICAILPHEYEKFFRGLSKVALRNDGMARAAMYSVEHDPFKKDD